MHRYRLRLGLLLLGPLLGSGCGGGAGDRPPVILISIDTLRADHVGLYGYERETTPFLDQWSTGGMIFERAFTTASWTLIAHMTMLTGLFPDQHDVIGRNRALSPGIPLLAERLKAAGYRTYALCNEGWVDERHGFQRGFDVFRQHTSLEEADAHLAELLPELEKSGPFFLFLHVFDAHCGDLGADAPYPAPPPYEDMFVGELPPLPDGPALEYWHEPDPLSDAQLETLTAQYDGGIRHVDDQLAKWFAELERRTVLQPALTIVTSDHGEALGQHGRLDLHGLNWHEGLHIPLIVRHPAGRGAGTRVSQPVHLGDLVPTILDGVGLPRDERLPGVSLFGPIPSERLISGTTKMTERFLLQWPRKTWLRIDGQKREVLETDLVADPGELAPRAGDKQSFEELRSKALGEGQFPKALKIEIAPEDQSQLDALGYGGESEDE